MIAEVTGVEPAKVERPIWASPFDHRFAFVVLSTESAAGEGLLGSSCKGPARAGLAKA